MNAKAASAKTTNKPISANQSEFPLASAVSEVAGPSVKSADGVEISGCNSVDGVELSLSAGSTSTNSGVPAGSATRRCSDCSRSGLLAAGEGFAVGVGVG
ncbi:hypothetical protein [Aurantiacibacter sp. MUD61]|uniref:hypothetical protein n=1 Tax=Aurantiacibacter sp. MUD61 TaxID=3009083 RepID=UPI0022F0D387|nr:hypothetical protein [Aurantiacibacter sp. MUD61]